MRSFVPFLRQNGERTGLRKVDFVEYDLVRQITKFDCSVTVHYRLYFFCTVHCDAIM